MADDLWNLAELHPLPIAQDIEAMENLLNDVAPELEDGMNDGFDEGSDVEEIDVDGEQSGDDAQEDEGSNSDSDGSWRVYHGPIRKRRRGRPLRQEPNPNYEGNGLRESFAKMFKDEETSDVVLVVGGRKFPCHKVILAAQSEYLRALFFNGMSETGRKEIELKDIDKWNRFDADRFELLLEVSSKCPQVKNRR